MMKNKSVIPTLVLELIIVVAVIVVTSIFCAGIYFPMANFIDFPTMILLLLFVIPSIIVSGRGKSFLQAFSIGKKEYRLMEMKKSLEAVKLVEKFVLCGTLLCLVVTLIVILHTLMDPSAIGPNVAIALVSIFYCVILEFFLVTIEAHVQNAVIDAMNIEDEEK